MVTTIPPLTMRSASCRLCPNTAAQRAPQMPSVIERVLIVLMFLLFALREPLCPWWSVDFLFGHALSCLNLLRLYAGELRVHHASTPPNTEIFHIAQHKHRNPRRRLHLDPSKLRSVHVIHHKPRPQILARMFNLDSIHLHSPRMTNEKPMCRSRSKHVRLGIILLFLRQLPLRILLRPTARMH